MVKKRKIPKSKSKVYIGDCAETLMPEIPLAPIERIFKKAGAERVGEDAIIALRDVLENVAYEVSVKSIELAKHAGRKTVSADDVKAVERIFKCINLS